LGHIGGWASTTSIFNYRCRRGVLETLDGIAEPISENDEYVLWSLHRPINTEE
jgi:hypothetical protein